MSASATSLIRKRSSASTFGHARRGTAEKYRNQDGNQQTSADFDGRTTSLRVRVFKRRFDVSSRWHAEGQARDAIHCRIRLYLRSRRLRCAPPRPGAAPGSALGGPPGARRASTPIRSPDQSAHSPRIRRRRCTAPAHPAANKTAPRLDGHGSLIRSRLCSPPGQAGQGRSLRARRHGDGASATLDSPAPPGGSGSYRMRHPHASASSSGDRTWRRPASAARSPGPTDPHASHTHASRS